jgi:hypothetical protein
MDYDDCIEPRHEGDDAAVIFASSVPEGVKVKEATLNAVSQHGGHYTEIIRENRLE